MARIVFIDDEPQIRSIAILVLGAAGHDIAVADDGRSGLEVVQQHHPDLVVIDILMPEMEGIETIVRLRRQSPRLKIIAISGALRGADYLRMAQVLGASVVLSKPFTPAELLSAIDEALE